MYGFRKVADCSDRTYSHPFFRRDCPDLLVKVRRVNPAHGRKKSSGTGAGAQAGGAADGAGETQKRESGQNTTTIKDDDDLFGAETTGESEEGDDDGAPAARKKRRLGTPVDTTTASAARAAEARGGQKNDGRGGAQSHPVRHRMGEDAGVHGLPASGGLDGRENVGVVSGSGASSADGKPTRLSMRRQLKIAAEKMAKAEAKGFKKKASASNMKTSRPGQAAQQQQQEAVKAAATQQFWSQQEQSQRAGLSTTSINTSISAGTAPAGWPSSYASLSLSSTDSSSALLSSRRAGGVGSSIGTVNGAAGMPTMLVNPAFAATVGGVKQTLPISSPAGASTTGLEVSWRRDDNESDAVTTNNNNITSYLPSSSSSLQHPRAVQQQSAQQHTSRTQQQQQASGIYCGSGWGDSGGGGGISGAARTVPGSVTDDHHLWLDKAFGFGAALARCPSGDAMFEGVAGDATNCGSSGGGTGWESGDHSLSIATATGRPTAHPALVTPTTPLDDGGRRTMRATDEAERTGAIGSTWGGLGSMGSHDWGNEPLTDGGGGGGGGGVWEEFPPVGLRSDARSNMNFGGGCSAGPPELGDHSGQQQTGVRGHRKLGSGLLWGIPMGGVGAVQQRGGCGGGASHRRSLSSFSSFSLTDGDGPISGNSLDWALLDGDASSSSLLLGGGGGGGGFDEDDGEFSAVSGSTPADEAYNASTAQIPFPLMAYSSELSSVSDSCSNADGAGVYSMDGTAVAGCSSGGADGDSWELGLPSVARPPVFA